MTPATSLALIAKAKRVFENDDTFLSFPVLTPHDYPPEKLRFVGPQADLGALAAFSALVNRIPTGSVFRDGSDRTLLGEYTGLFARGQLASGTPTPADVLRYVQAEAVLNRPGPDGRPEPTPEHLAYRRCRDAWIAALEAYKSGQISALTADAAGQAQWREVDEPALRKVTADAKRVWETDGFRAKVEAAEQVKLDHVRRAADHGLWKVWRESYDSMLDDMTDAASGGSAAAPFVPADALDTDWPTFTLTGAEVAALAADAPPEVRAALDPDAGAEVLSLSFEFRSVGLARPWLRPEVFRARFWRLPAGDPPLSAGGDPPSGTCPAYIAGVVFARNIVEVPKPPTRTVYDATAGTATIRGTWMFSFDTGTEGVEGDVWWNQKTESDRALMPQGAAKLADLGFADFDSLGPATLTTALFSSNAISGNDDATDRLQVNRVLAVRTKAGRFAKVQILDRFPQPELMSIRTLKVRWVTYVPVEVPVGGANPAVAPAAPVPLRLDRMPWLKPRRELLVPRAAVPVNPVDAILRHAITPVSLPVDRSVLRAVSPAERVDRSVFLRRPGLTLATPISPLAVSPTPSPSPPPSSHPPPTAPEQSRHVTILAFICKRLPKCPDPDPTLDWPD